jgi:integrase
MATAILATPALSFGDLIDDFERAYLPNLAKPTQYKYNSLLRCHVKPALAPLRIEEVTTRRLDEWLANKTREGLSWAARADLRNLVCSIYTRAELWGTWDGKNPAKRANPGRRAPLREKRKLTGKQTIDLMKKLPTDVRVVAMVALFCGLRISEVMGLCWKHVDFERGMFLVRQRYWRGDVDRTKTLGSDRDVPFGHLRTLLTQLYPGPEGAERFCFDIKTIHGITRDDRTIRRYFLRPAAEKLGIYYAGFGFHALRREAITEIASKSDALQASRVAGHTHMDVTLLYGLNDYGRQEKAIKSIQEPFVTLGLLGASR